MKNVKHIKSFRNLEFKAGDEWYPSPDATLKSVDVVPFERRLEDENECVDSPYGIFATNKGDSVTRYRRPCLTKKHNFTGRFKVKFTIRFNKNIGGWSNVFRFTKTGRNCCN